MFDLMLALGQEMSWSGAGFSPPVAIAYGNACVIGSDVYFFGRDSANAWSPLYKLSGTTVHTVTSIPRPRFGMRLFGYGNSIYVFGSGTSAEDRILQKYNITTGVWSNQLTYSKDLIWSSLCQDGPRVYLTASGVNRDDTEITCFDLSAADIEIKKYPVTNVNRGHMLMGVNDGKVYFGGGFTDAGSFSAFSDFYCLDLVTGIQRRLPDMPEAGYFGMSYGSIGRKLIALNPLSGTNATATATHSTKVFSFDYVTEEWAEEMPTTVGINHAACFTLGGKFTRISGRNQTTYTKECISLR